MLRIERQSITRGDRANKAFESLLFSRADGFSFDQGEGRLLTEQVRLGASGFRVARVSSTGHLISLAEDRDVTLLFPRAGTLAVQMARNEAVIRTGQSGFFLPQPRTTHAKATQRGRFEAFVLLLPAAELARIGTDAGVEAIFGRDFLPTQGTASQRISAYLEFLAQDIQRRSQVSITDRAVANMAAQLRDLVADWLVRSFDVPRQEAAATSAADFLRVRRAEEIFRERSGDAVSIAAVARELGLSLRSLQAAFRNVQGDGPKSCLTRIRLELARERLLDAGPEDQVTAIALDCGFTHLSRFAEAYHRVFGERPSATLACRRRPARKCQGGTKPHEP